MSLFHIFSFLLVLAAVYSFINHKYIKLPGTISLMIFGLALSLLVQAIGAVSPAFETSVEKALSGIDFAEILLDFMLSFLLFAGALHTDLNKLANSKWPIMTFATLGVLISTFITGTVFYYGIQLFGLELNYIHCLLFGALISPTDPIAVLGILKKANLPKKLEVKIVGESLFNDGFAVVLFITIFQMAERGVENISVGYIGTLLLEEVAGGVVLGLVLGYLAYLLIKNIDHYQTEVLITLAVVMGGYAIATLLHFSGPLAVVVAGLFIGNRSKTSAMSELSFDYTNKFWEIVDEILNAALFLLIGLELLLIEFHTEYIWIGLIMAIILVFIRLFSLGLLSYILGFKKTFEPNTLPIVSWGGLRGGISIALALTLRVAMDKEIIVGVTYVIVLFSIIVQGLTVEKLIKYYRSKSVDI